MGTVDERHDPAEMLEGMDLEGLKELRKKLDRAIASYETRRRQEAVYAVEQAAHFTGGFAELGIGERELQKHAMIEVLPFDLEAVLNGSLDERGKQTMLIVLYQQSEDGRPMYFTKPV